jgi:hypothetical protein
LLTDGTRRPAALNCPSAVTQAAVCHWQLGDHEEDGQDVMAPVN